MNHMLIQFLKSVSQSELHQSVGVFYVKSKVGSGQHLSIHGHNLHVYCAIFHYDCCGVGAESSHRWIFLYSNCPYLFYVTPMHDVFYFLFRTYLLFYEQGSEGLGEHVKCLLEEGRGVKNETLFRLQDELQPHQWPDKDFIRM